mgnify:CR=1 FL=1
MRIEPLRDYVVVTLRPEEGNGHRGGLVVVRAAKNAIREAEVVGVGPECRDIHMGDTVLINLLVASQIGEQYLVPEPTILGTLP